MQNSKNLILETKLAGFNAQGIKGVYKIVVICEDESGNDKADIRIDRLINREKISIEEAKGEVIEREENDLEKWRRLYAKDDPNWNYWDKKYYDLVVNTYSYNKDETLQFVLKKIGYKAIVTQNVEQAIQKAQALAKKEDLICATGSLYLAGEVKQKFPKIVSCDKKH